ncbi:RNA-dependent RNA polymerase [Histoplasma capsulatum G186AR]|uniref:RNA-dependent RNA polymerase n=1 Tax=Ajellomyces capsulatus (strain G186AR / H82 / ATCC MYA-2454 / RMSCC 2432) TaxID=447093 RepID=C0NTX4_AJECG|nr:RNA-dependent RNA polymerase [Histoplasma capsulatum G186AR]EEH05485.1 RNA-dependent RNA polymerase [Histoplasma capsulatum G186AR]
MATPRTPRSGVDFNLLIYNLNATYNLDLPNPPVSTPRQRPIEGRSLPERCVGLAKFLYYDDPVNFQRVIDSFSEWAMAFFSGWVQKPKQEPEVLPSSRSFIRSNTISMARNITPEQRARVLDELWKVLSDEEYIVTRGASRIPRGASVSSPAGARSGPGCDSGVAATTTGDPMAGSGTKSNGAPKVPPTAPAKMPPSPTKRKEVVDHSEVFSTAPSTPSNPLHMMSSSSSDDEFENSDLDNLDINLDISSLGLADSSDNNQGPKAPKQRRIDEYMTTSKNVRKSVSSPSGKPLNNENTSFQTVTTEQSNSFGASFGASTPATSFSRSFETGQFDLNEASTYSSTARPPPDAKFSGLWSNANTTSPSKNTKMQPEADLEWREQKIRNIIQDLEENGPFSSQNVVKTTVPLRYRYEAQRAANFFKVPAENILQKLDRRKLPEYEDFWKSLHDGEQERLEKTAPEPWDMAVDQYKDRKLTGDVMTLSCELTWCSQKEPGYFKLTLKPLKLLRGYRFCRRFGSDRFLELTYPILTEPPAHLVRKGNAVEKEILIDAISRWMATSEHHLVGRVWKVLYLEDIQNKQKKAKKYDSGEIRAGGSAIETPHKQKAYFFATDGIDFRKARDPLEIPPQGETSGQRTSMSIDALIDWHMPRAKNGHQSDMKLFQRLHLGLSRTLATVILRREEIIYVKNPPGTVMNDGCALMSKSLGMAVASALGLDGHPAIFQARISGAKGVWMVDLDDSRFKTGDRGFWLQITQSQLKIHPAPPHDTKPMDDTQLTFEVVQWSRPLSPASLNMQLLNILQHGGIRNDHIRNLIKQEMSSFYDEFLRTLLCSSGVECRSWLQKMKWITNGSSKRQPKRTDNFFPSQYAEQAIMLLDAGFLPLKLPYLTKIFRRLLQDYLDNLKKLKITVSQSTFAYCVADPFGVLRPDEVHLGFSREWEHGSAGTELHDIDVLLARLPAHLATDIQKRRSVYKNELRHMKDVIVFPTTGDTPLASLLSGGDYDGDQCWVCWDPIIVREFKSTEFDPGTVPSAESLGLRSCSTLMSEIGSTEEFLTNAFRFNVKPSKLGQCTIERETYCYHENNIASPMAVKLAWLLSYLVDSKKAGLELTDDAWEYLKPKYSKVITEKQPLVPAYKSLSRGFKPLVWNSCNIIDYLLFDVIVAESDQMLVRFDKFCSEHCELPLDHDLLSEWGKVEKRGIKEKDEMNPVLYNALNDIKKRFRDKKINWERQHGLNSETPYSRKILEAAQSLQELTPPNFDHPLSHTWANSTYEWERLRALCAYKDCRSDFVWYAVGPVLCEIKAKAMGQCRIVLPNIHKVLHVNRNVAKRVAEDVMRRNAGELSGDEGGGEDDYDDDDDEFFDIDPFSFPEDLERDIDDTTSHNSFP